jgi:hypothetical protein
VVAVSPIIGGAPVRPADRPAAGIGVEVPARRRGFYRDWVRGY